MVTEMAGASDKPKHAPSAKQIRLARAHCRCSRFLFALAGRLLRSLGRRRNGGFRAVCERRIPLYFDIGGRRALKCARMPWGQRAKGTIPSEDSA